MEGRARGRLIEGERNSIQSRNSIPPIQRNSIPPIQPNFYSKPAHTLLSFPQGPIPNKAQRLTRKFSICFISVAFTWKRNVIPRLIGLDKKGPSSIFHKCVNVISCRMKNAEYKIQSLHNLQHIKVFREISWSP